MKGSGQSMFKNEGGQYKLDRNKQDKDYIKKCKLPQNCLVKVALQILQSSTNSFQLEWGGKKPIPNGDGERKLVKMSVMCTLGPHYCQKE